MKSVFVGFMVAIALSGCVSYAPTMPADYKGPRAIVKDSVKSYGSTKADFFYVSHVDGREIENSRAKTRRMNHGQGLNMTPFILENPIPAKLAILTIVGRTEYAAPILALTNTTYQVTGTVEVIPEADTTYVVRGVLGESYSAVWVEEEKTHKVVGKKIEINSSSKLGIFEK